MFQTYSERAKMVIFFARFKAGKDGASSIGVDHILEGVVAEDQGKEGMCRFLGADPTNTSLTTDDKKRPPIPFFSPDVASQLLHRLDQVSSHSQPISNSTDMQISAEASRALTAALGIAHELHSARVEPLHLLAAALEQEMSDAVQVFSDFGITDKEVLTLLSQQSTRSSE
jgi:ATP-dependent Clp protease ATP-binding subunit ClpC